MTQEDKELLLKDLCSRLPYGVKGQAKGMIKFFTDEEISEEPWTLTSINVQLNTFGADTQTGIPLFNRRTGICNFKSYLFPMSSMTEEQLKDVKSVLHQEIIDIYENCSEERKVPEYPQTWYYVQNWYNAHHFDYQGLIEKGLALDATGLNIY